MSEHGTPPVPEQPPSKSDRSGWGGASASMLGVGVAIGVVIGLMLDNIGAGIAIGIALGLAMGQMQAKRAK